MEWACGVLNFSDDLLLISTCIGELTTFSKIQTEKNECVNNVNLMDNSASVIWVIYKGIDFRNFCHKGTIVNPWAR